MDEDAAFVESAANYLTRSNLKTVFEWLTTEVRAPKGSRGGRPRRRRRVVRLRQPEPGFPPPQALFAEPEDPLAFIRDVVSAKIAQRASGQRYSSEDPERYLGDVYAHPPAPGAAAATAAPAAPEAAETRATDPLSPSASARLERLELIAAASRAIAAELDPLKAAATIVREACRLLRGDRATLFRTVRRPR